MLMAECQGNYRKPYTPFNRLTVRTNNTAQTVAYLPDTNWIGNLYYSHKTNLSESLRYNPNEFLTLFKAVGSMKFVGLGSSVVEHGTENAGVASSTLARGTSLYS